MTVDQAALGILRIVNNNMALAINANSVAKGVDPRIFYADGVRWCRAAHAVSLAEAIFAGDVISPVQPAPHGGDRAARHRPPVRIHPLDGHGARHGDTPRTSPR